MKLQKTVSQKTVSLIGVALFLMSPLASAQTKKAKASAAKAAPSVTEPAVPAEPAAAAAPAAEAALAAAPATPSADSPSGRELWGVEDLYVDAGGFFGYSSIATSKQKLAQSGFGFTAAIWAMPELFVGVTSDFRLINQYSAVDASGNMRGTRWNMASPTVGYKLGHLTLKLDVQLLGDYKLSKSTVAGTAAAYKSPLGARLAGIYPVWEQVNVGWQFEYLQFSKINDTTLSAKLKQMQVGLNVAYVF
ncbi:MAG: hypothetical protein NDJ89_04810 [Oligoflexia bacterium]|nr:hypothetical protein [Oligoflexia bacterium]